jgi:hypothetical protein
MICIVIVNYRTAALAINCLDSLVGEQESVKLLTVEIVDNASADNSAEILSKAIQNHGWTDWVNLINAPENGGFAYGNNIGIRRALQQHPEVAYVLLLNPDTVVRPGAIEVLKSFLMEHPRVGIVGSRLEEPDSTAQVSAFRYPSLASECIDGLRWGMIKRLFADAEIAHPLQDVPHSADWVAGASMMIRREVFDQIGLLDEGYFMYYEEVDFCKRAQQAGWECWYVPQSRVIHLVGQASGINSADTKPKRRPDYVFESRLRYFQKHHGRLYSIFADIVWLATYPVWRLRRWIQRKPDTDPPYLWWDTLWHSSMWHRIKP